MLDEREEEEEAVKSNSLLMQAGVRVRGWVVCVCGWDEEALVARRREREREREKQLHPYPTLSKQGPLLLLLPP